MTAHAPLLPRWRINLLRLCYLVMVGGLGIFVVPRLIVLPADWAASSAVIACFLGALCGLSVFGLFRPLAMLPVLLFELAWKFIFILRIALGPWLAGTLDPKFEAVFWECVPVLLFVPLIPWGFVWRHYLPQRAAPA
jgi:hypothetical protein